MHTRWANDMGLLLAESSDHYASLTSPGILKVSGSPGGPHRGHGIALVLEIPQTCGVFIRKLASL